MLKICKYNIIIHVCFEPNRVKFFLSLNGKSRSSRNSIGRILDAKDISERRYLDIVVWLQNYFNTIQTPFTMTFLAKNRHKNKNIQTLRGHEAGKGCSDIISRATCLLLWKSYVSGTNCPRICCTKINWFESGRHEAGGKWSQFSVSHRVHCSCNLSPLQLEPVSSWCAGACVQFLHRALYAYNTHEEASPRRNIPASACWTYCSRIDGTLVLLG